MAAAALLLILLFVSGCGSEPTAVEPQSANEVGAKPPADADEPASAAEQENEPQAESTPKQVGPTITPEQFRQLALDGNLPRMVLAIERGIDVNAVDTEGRSALMLACFNGHTRVIRTLLDQSADPRLRDTEGRSALMYAATIDNLEVVQMLLTAGSEINATDKAEGWTALMFAAGEGHLAVVSELLSAGADRQIKDIDGDTAEAFAIQRGHTEVVKILRRPTTGS